MPGSFAVTAGRHSIARPLDENKKEMRNASPFYF
jgi:hypothetical protein